MLSKQNRLTAKADFENVRQNGKFVSTPFFSLTFWKRGNAEISRFGFIVSKKISLKAHERNKVKRMLREVVRKNMSEVKSSYDFVIIAKKSLLKANFSKIEKEVKNVLENI